MGDKTKLSFATKCIHTGNGIDKETSGQRAFAVPPGMVCQ
ncbi:hypothetical protein SPACI_011540 [Sporomusa acidovorans DSM 3132]|uniref:Uncharacterized protein n=1 Tax=Sporomusa acidovorans (strain ATCC 49682 / DSM 3132 / Mol) TaxID=1123286 RepID=A0ABZ3IYI2_SPOA4|nr:hypothetical protein SPACI_38670 [Sporomusa acidovorans DSM 3132]SDF14992.1 hypothetical protein SAMN04488499_10351 [Sporomusa acidovorans]